MNLMYYSIHNIILQLRRGENKMNPLLIANWILFIAVVCMRWIVRIFIKTRIQYIKLGKKVEFEDNVKKDFAKYGCMFSDKRNY